MNDKSVPEERWIGPIAMLIMAIGFGLVLSPADVAAILGCFFIGLGLGYLRWRWFGGDK